MVESVPIALQVPWRQSNKILPANGTNLITIASGGTTNAGLAPTKIFAVVTSNNDTISHDIQIGIVDSVAGFMPLGTVTVPVNAGYVGTVPSVSLLNSIAALPLDEPGQSYCFLNATDILQVKCTIAAVNTGKEVDIVVFGADF
jgi:hypothetical protein